MSIDVSNIFNLVGRFGADEDRLTAAFGFLLKNDSQLFVAFAQALGLELGPVAQYDMRTQTAYRRFGFDEGDDRNRIDLEIVLPTKLTVLVESKIGGNKFSETQLEKYGRLLEDRRIRGDEVRLVLITHLDEADRFQAFARSLKLGAAETGYLRWTDICSLVKTRAAPKQRFLNQQFLRQVERRMSDLKVISEMPVGDVREVMIVTVDPTNMRKALSGLRYECQNERPRRQESQYVAFYETQGPKQIQYVARVQKTEINVPVASGVAKVYTLESPFKLKRPIPKGRIPANFPVLYTTFERLLCADDLDDLRIRK